MKKKVVMALLMLFPLVALSGLFWFLHVKSQLPTDIKNSEAKALEFKDNTIVCPQCHMSLVGKKDTAQIITKGHKTYFFDDVGCAIMWLKAQKIEPRSVVFWVFSADSNRYVDAYSAFYSSDESTPMAYGFRAYEQRTETRIDFDTMYLRMVRGETMHDPKLRHPKKGE